MPHAKYSFTFRTRTDFQNNVPKNKNGIYVICQKGQIEGLYGRTNNIRNRILGSYIPPLYVRNRKRGRPIEIMGERPLRWGRRVNVQFWEFTDNETVIRMETTIKRMIKRTNMCIRNEGHTQLELYRTVDLRRLVQLIETCLANE
jgi:hypothetical protein